MSTILCPTRGGEKSYPTQDRAIQMAKEREADLVFLYVSDVRFLFRGSGAIVIDLEKELDEMGEFLLTMAQERAEAEGIRAKKVVEHGAFREALGKVIADHEVSAVVLGAPGEENQLTTGEYLEQLAEHLVEKYRVEVIVVEQGEVDWYMAPPADPREDQE